MKIRVCYHGNLDGTAYESSNEYVKEHDKSIFDSLTKPIDYQELSKYFFGDEPMSFLEELKVKESISINELKFGLLLEDTEKVNLRKLLTLSVEEKSKMDKEWLITKQVLESIVIASNSLGDKVVWIEPPFPNMKCQIIPLDDMHYKYPPDAVDEYDEGFRFTQGQLSMLLDWLKAGKKNEPKDSFPMDDMWEIVKKVLESIIIITIGTGNKVVWIEPMFSYMWCEIIKLEDMYYKFPSDSAQNTQGYDEGYRFNSKQLDMLMDWLENGFINRDRDPLE